MGEGIAGAGPIGRQRAWCILPRFSCGSKMPSRRRAGMAMLASCLLLLIWGLCVWFVVGFVEGMMLDADDGECEGQCSLPFASLLFFVTFTHSRLTQHPLSTLHTQG